MLKQILLFLPFFCCATTFAQDAVTPQQEAARFAKESEFLHSQGRFDVALEAAETAAALDPENNELRKLLFNAIVYRGMHLLQPSENFGYGPSSTQPKVEMEAVRQAARLADRALELGESFGKRDRFQVLGDHPIDLFRHSLHNVTVKYYPELKPESDRINLHLLHYWLENRFRPKFAQIHDTESCKEAIQMLGEANTLYFHSQTPEALADAFGETMEALLRLTKQWDVDATRLDVVNEHCLIFAEVAAQHRNALLPSKDGKADTAFDRTITLLENDSRPFFQVYGWIARNKPVYDLLPEKTIFEYTWDNSVNRQQSREYFAKLIAHLDEQPPGMAVPERNLFYRELSRFTFASGVKENNPSVVDLSGGLPYYHSVLDYIETILETACRRNEAVPDVVMEIMQHFSIIRFYFQGSDDEAELARFREIEQRFKQWVSRQIELAQNEDKQGAERLKTAAIKYKMTLESPFPLSKPWIEEIEYQQVRKDGGNFDAVLRGETIYFFRIRPEVKLRLDQFDTRTGKMKSSEELPCRIDADWISTPGPGHNAAFVDDRNAYFGWEKSGILVFPLDGSKPWRVTEEDGLPSNTVQGIGTIGGKLYAGLGERNLRSWFVAVDLKTKKIDILASSSARGGTIPFYNLSPAPRFPFFIEDAKRNRLLLFVDGGSDKHEIGGLWAIDGTTGNFTQLKQFQCWARYGQLLADGDHILVHGDQTTYLIDLNDTNRDTPAESLFRGTNHRGDPTVGDCYMQYGVVFNGYLWGYLGNMSNGFPWARIPLDPKSTGGVETLQRLPSPGQEYDGDLQILIPMPDGKRLFVSKGYDMILLRFE